MADPRDKEAQTSRTDNPYWNNVPYPGGMGEQGEANYSDNVTYNTSQPSGRLRGADMDPRTFRTPRRDSR